MPSSTKRVNRCDHGSRPSECRACLREWAEEQAWRRAVDEEVERARLLGFARPDEHTAYLDLLESYGGDELPETWVDLVLSGEEVSGG